ncbi:aspartic peptidase A1 [Suillus spraguei]|nr:aspartic peptidase A1 [Suillus spraguei]
MLTRTATIWSSLFQRGMVSYVANVPNFTTLSNATSFLTFLLLALSITGSPVEIRNSPITLPIVGRLNFSNDTVNLLHYDKAHAAALRNPSKRGHARRITPAFNRDVTYITAVAIGSPPTTYNMIVDTGSSNTWLAASTKYVVTETSVNTHQHVEVVSPSGIFSGTEYLDTVILGSGITVTEQSIGVAITSTDFPTGVDGVLGIGPVGLTEGTLPQLSTMTIPTVTDNLYKQGAVSQDIVSAFFQPSNPQTETQGQLTFGGTDATMYTGDIAYTPITTANPASTYWGIDGSITYVSMTILSSTAGIFQTGTSFILIATDALTKYQSATGAALDKKTGFLTVSSAQYSVLKNLNFHIGTETYSLTPNAQIWPRSLNSKISGASNVIYLIVNDIGTHSGMGLDFVCGLIFLQRFYSVFDTANSRIGLAKTSFTNATTN